MDAGGAISVFLSLKRNSKTPRAQCETRFGRQSLVCSPVRNGRQDGDGLKINNYNLNWNTYILKWSHKTALVTCGLFSASLFLKFKFTAFLGLFTFEYSKRSLVLVPATYLTMETTCFLCNCKYSHHTLIQKYETVALKVDEEVLHFFNCRSQIWGTLYAF